MLMPPTTLLCSTCLIICNLLITPFPPSKVNMRYFKAKADPGIVQLVLYCKLESWYCIGIVLQLLSRMRLKQSFSERKIIFCMRSKYFHVNNVNTKERRDRIFIPKLDMTSLPTNTFIDKCNKAFKIKHIKLRYLN